MESAWQSKTSDYIISENNIYWRLGLSKHCQNPSEPTRHWAPKNSQDTRGKARGSNITATDSTEQYKTSRVCVGPVSYLHFNACITQNVLKYEHIGIQNLALYVLK